MLWMKTGFQLVTCLQKAGFPVQKSIFKANQSLMKVQVNGTFKKPWMRRRIKNEGTKSPLDFYSNIPRYYLQYERGRSSSSGVLEYN